MSETFIVKRGMVFYLDQPQKDQPVPCTSEFCKQKNRPYIVVSNNVCNEKSNFVNVAPCTSKPPSQDKWWYVPFRKESGSYSWVDISQITLVAVSSLTIANYSEAITRYTLNNQDFLKRLQICCAKRLGCELDDSSLYESERSTQVTQQPLNITVNIPGLEKLSEMIELYLRNTFAKSVVSINTQPEVSSVVDDSCVVTPEEPVKVAKEAQESWEKSFSNAKMLRIYNTILALSQYFNGNMSDEKVAKECQVSLSTIYRYRIKLQNNNGNIPELKKPAKKSKPDSPKKTRTRTIPNNMKQEFCSDFMLRTKDFLLEKYSPYGLDTWDKIRTAYERRTKKSYYVKKQK